MEPLHQPNNIIAKKYEIINTLGEGGSGITYLAQDLQTNKNVAFSNALPVIYTDIKPQNIIRSDDNKVFLVDFAAVAHTYHNTASSIIPLIELFF